jgi:HEAT repeat protein
MRRIMLMRARYPFLALALAALPALAPAFTQAASPGEQALVERERARAEIESIVADLYRPAPPGTENRFHEASARLIAIGEPAVPFMVSEVDEPSAATFNIAAYVLGSIGTPEARDALRKAVARAESDGGKFGAARKIWAIYGLALAGDEEAVRLLDQGLWVGPNELMDRVGLVELAAVLTAPRSVPILLEELQRYRDDETNQPRLIYALRALRLIADPATFEPVASFLGHERWQLRLEATRALAELDDPRVVDRLFATLDDPQVDVREAAAKGLASLKPFDRTRDVLARLETEKATAVRIPLYHLLGESGDEHVLEAFRSHWGRPDYLDRAAILHGVADIGSRKGLDLLVKGLHDADGSVALVAIDGLTRLGGSEARDALLSALRSPSRGLVDTAIGSLAQLGDSQAAPRIARFLFEGYLAQPVTDPQRITTIRAASEAFVKLHYTAALPGLRKAAQAQLDAGVQSQIAFYLQGVVRQLTDIERFGNRAKKWVEALASDDEPVLHVAITRLTEIGGPVAAEGLIAAFPGADTDDRFEILRAIATLRSRKAVPLIERLLLDPEYDARKLRHLRAMAAWAARRIGGPEMADLLGRSVERRQGLDIGVLTYLAQLRGREAVPVLQRYRVSRLRDIRFDRGYEVDRIDWLIRELRAGRSIASLDRPPDEIALGEW